MKQRADTRAVQFFRPEFSQLIKGQLDGHGVVLAQRGNSRDPVVAAAVSAALHKSSQYESDDYGNCRKDRAKLGEQFAMARVKS
jgi:hypothetical protein